MVVGADKGLADLFAALMIASELDHVKVDPSRTAGIKTRRATVLE